MSTAFETLALFNFFSYAAHQREWKENLHFRYYPRQREINEGHRHIPGDFRPRR